MHDMDETHGVAVFLLVVVLILVFAYCRMTVGVAKAVSPPQPNAPQTVEAAGGAGR